MKRYKLIIFDYDGTLASTESAIVTCMRKTFTEFGIEPPGKADISKTIGLGLKDAIKILYPPVIARDIPEWIKTYRDYYRSEGQELVELFDDVKSILEKANSSGIAVVVMSNKGVDAITTSLSKFGVAKYVNLVIGDQPGIAKKPDPMVFNSVIHPAFPEINVNNILVVGDTDADLKFARNIGAHSCWASYGYGDRDLCKSLKPTYVIENIAELENILVC